MAMKPSVPREFRARRWQEARCRTEKWSILPRPRHSTGRLAGQRVIRYDAAPCPTPCASTTTSRERCAAFEPLAPRRRGGALHLRPHRLRLSAHRQLPDVPVRGPAEARARMERLSRPPRDEHHRCRPSDLRRRHRRRQDGEGRAQDRQVGVGDRAALHGRVRRRHEGAQYRGPRGIVPGDRPHPGADRLHRGHREERLHLPHLRRHLFRHFEAAGLRLSCASRPQGPGGRQARGRRRKAQPDRLRAVEVLGARREAADGVGQSLGQGLSGMAHRVLGDGAEVSRRLLRHSLWRRRPHSRAPHERDRADRSARRHPSRQLLAARLFPAVERREDGEVRGGVPAARLSRRARLRSARLPLPVPHRALPRSA